MQYLDRKYEIIQIERAESSGADRAQEKARGFPQAAPPSSRWRGQLSFAQNTSSLGREPLAVRLSGSAADIALLYSRIAEAGNGNRAPRKPPLEPQQSPGLHRWI